MLGGGLVPGSLVLLGGAPGIGKSTLTGMALGNLVAAGRRVLYVSGEESAAQVRLRAERLGEAALAVPALAETSLEAVLATLEAERPDVCVIDSIQTLAAEGMTGAPGSVGQVRECAAAGDGGRRSGSDCATVLVGHVTKEGAVAGPRVLEHLVDCVLLFEGERERSYRTLRALKNRFGATSEVGRLRDALGRSRRGRRPLGSLRRRGERGAGLGACSASMEGTRPLLVEVQALVAPTEIVPPRRVANGDRPQPPGDGARRARAPRRASRSAAADVFVNVAGGVRVDEPGADLAVALALASAHRGRGARGRGGRPLACFGEVGLTGELRYVAHPERRVAEAGSSGSSPVRRPGGAMRRSLRRSTAGDALRERVGCGAGRVAAPGAPAPARPPQARGRLAAEPVRARHGLDKRHSDLSTRDSAGGFASRAFCHHHWVTPHEGDELNELEARLDPRLLRALDMVAPGTALREGIDGIIHARTGGLILLAEPDDVSFLLSGGIKLDVDYNPALLYQLAKMDGAIVLDAAAERILWANVQLMPDPTILSMETGTRHRTAERAKEQWWRRQVRQWRSSGLSVRAFAPQQGLSEPSFYAWRRTLAEREATAVPFVPLTVTPEPRPATAGRSVRRRAGVGPGRRPTPAHRAGVRWANAGAAAGSLGGGPAMMLSLPTAVRIWLATRPTDLRKSFDSLAELVRQQLAGDPLSGQLFVFRNKRADRVKLLYWDEDGFVIVYKRLEAGTFRFPEARPPAWRSAPPTCRCCSTASIWTASSGGGVIAGRCRRERTVAGHSRRTPEMASVFVARR